MKTLVVLSALAAVALAAPAPLEEGLENFKKITTNVPGVFKRERKSTSEHSHSENPIPGAPANLSPASQISEFGVSGRNFGLKKPIIIKKKPVGIRVYRDSGEEIAESGETCGKQVKVKFCEAKSEDKMKTSNAEDLNTQVTKEDMKHSIKLAKEAVENLQRDLQIVEQKPGTQESLWNHGHSESDAELHQDIEVAREALEHIHKNFGNIESMSLHATTLKSADSMDDAHFTIAKTEEQRLAQWKEAIDTIQKNVEIAKNIEDSFKAASAESGLLGNDDTVINNNHAHNADHMRTTKDMVKDENKVDSENCKIDHAHEKTSEKDDLNTGFALADDDMTSSASTISEKKLEDLLTPENTRHASELSDDSQIEKALNTDESLKSTHKGKDADIQSITMQSHMPDLMKIEERKPELEKKEDEVKTKTEHTESTDSMPESSNIMKSVESEDMLMEQQRNAAAATDKAQPQKSLPRDDLLEKMKATDMKQPEMKSSDHLEEQHNNNNRNEDKSQGKDHTQKAEDVDTTMLMKSVEEIPTNTQKELLTTTKIHENKPHDGSFEQHKGKEANHEDAKQLSEMNIPNHHFESGQIHHHKQSLSHENHPEMRTVDHFNNVHQHQFVEPSQNRWADNKNLHLQMESMKSADSMPHQSMDHVHTVQHPGHQHRLTHSVKNHFDTPTGHGQHRSQFSDNFMAQGKSADFDMQSYYMRDGSGLGPENHRYRWKPTHEAPRNAYGAPAAAAVASSSSDTAVGLFPNAKVGSCGIPLLLSCNPSVVPGSLAKAHPAPYSAPAYRNEEEFNFHTKRDVKKTHEHMSTLNRTPNVNQKASNVLVAKQ